MHESLLGLVLSRLDSIRHPVVAHSETVEFEAERNDLIAAGILRKTADAEEISRPRRFPPGGNLIVQRTSRGLFGVAEEGNFFQPLPLVPEDVLLYEVSVPHLVARLQRENGIIGEVGVESDGILPMGQKAVPGQGMVPVFFSAPNDGEARLIARWHRIRRPPPAPKAAVILPRTPALSPEGWQVLDGLGVVLAPLMPGGRAVSLRIDWSMVFPDSMTRGGYPKEVRIFRRQGATWLLVFDGLEKTASNSKGMAYISHLLMNPGKPIFCADLRDVVAGVTTPRHLGSGGEVLPPDVLEDYKRRLRENEEGLELARELGGTTRIEELESEAMVLKAEIARGAGLFGRGREASSDRKRARQSVSAAVNRAIDAVTRSHPTLGSHLARSITPGERLSYNPDPPIPWAQ